MSSVDLTIFKLFILKNKKIEEFQNKINSNLGRKPFKCLKFVNSEIISMVHFESCSTKQCAEFE